MNISSVAQRSVRPAAVADSPKAKGPDAAGASPAGSPKRVQDTVAISASATAALAALKEATETSAQTASEAGAGDHQAQRLLAKEAAERAG